MGGRPEVGAGVADIDLTGRTVLITGATSGVGREAVLALGRLGARVLIHGRDEERGEALLERLTATGSPDPRFFQADFLSLDAVRRLALEVNSDAPSIDVLVNNAGAYFPEGGLTAEGVEQTFAVNHLAPFLLTNLLLRTIPAGGRIVTVASEAHRNAELNLQDVQTIANYDGFTAYARSKLANLLFTFELAARLPDRAVNACHPGLVPGSDIWRNASLPIRTVMGILDSLPSILTGRFVKSPAQGAESVVYLASSPDAGAFSGEYVSDCRPTSPAPNTREEVLQRKLWRFSEELVGLPAAETPSR